MVDVYVAVSANKKGIKRFPCTLYHILFILSRVFVCVCVCYLAGIEVSCYFYSSVLSLLTIIIILIGGKTI